MRVLNPVGVLKYLRSRVDKNLIAKKDWWRVLFDLYYFYGHGPEFFYQFLMVFAKYGVPETAELWVGELHAFAMEFRDLVKEKGVIAKVLTPGGSTQFVDIVDMEKPISPLTTDMDPFVLNGWFYNLRGTSRGLPFPPSSIMEGRQCSEAEMWWEFGDRVKVAKEEAGASTLPPIGMAERIYRQFP